MPCSTTLRSYLPGAREKHVKESVLSEYHLVYMEDFRTTLESVIALRINAEATEVVRPGSSIA
jgi:hypothetical protein